MIRTLLIKPLLAATLLTGASLGPVAAEDRHVGYYYPEPQEIEVYEPRVLELPGNDRLRRIGFVTGMMTGLMSQPYPPTVSIFAKGAEAEKLIIVGLEDHRYNSAYRMRGLLAMMTAFARNTPALQQTGYEEYLTFFDLCGMLGFQQITFTDGQDFAHQILLRPGGAQEPE